MTSCSFCKRECSEVEDFHLLLSDELSNDLPFVCEECTIQLATISFSFFAKTLKSKKSSEETSHDCQKE